MCILCSNYIYLFECASNLGCREFKFCFKFVHRGDVSCGSSS